jgi:peptidoglycan-associated lipoprotein
LLETIFQLGYNDGLILIIKIGAKMSTFSKSLSALLLALVFLTTGCSEKNVTPMQEPIDSMSVDGNIDNIQSVNENGEEMQDGVSGKKTPLEEGLEVVYFDFEQYDVRDDMENLLQDNGEKLNSDTYRASSIKLEGNCDEWGSDQYNYALGLKRARAVKEFLVGEGIDESRFSIISYGESNNICKAKTQECWAKNRRVDFRLLP